MEDFGVKGREDEVARLELLALAGLLGFGEASSKSKNDVFFLVKGTGVCCSKLDPPSC